MRWSRGRGSKEKNDEKKKKKKKKYNEIYIYDNITIVCIYYTTTEVDA